MKVPPSRLVAFLVLPGLLVGGMLADRALDGAQERARERAAAQRVERSRQAGLALRAQIANAEEAAASGRASPVASWRVAAPLSGRLAPRTAGLEGLSRADLIVRASSRDVTPSGLPVAVVAAATLGEERVMADVAEDLLSGRLRANPDDLPALAAILGRAGDARIAPLVARLRTIPPLASLPRVPDFHRAARGSVVEGWARDGDDVVHWRLAVGTWLLEGVRVAGPGDAAAVSVEGVDGLALTAALDESEVRRVARQRIALGVGVVALALLVAGACWLLARDERAVARERAFLASVTHELRTPVTAMRLLGETLAEGRGQPQEYGALIATECERVEALVERSLLAARTQERVALAPTRVEDVVTRVMALAEPAARRKGKTLALEPLPGLPGAMWDADSVRQALSNLVDNAVRHGGPNVRVGARCTSEGVSLFVHDDGPGIRRRDRSRVFGRFERGGGSSGAGLGLWLAEQVARGHGGRIDLATEEGRGCTFTLVLPLDAPHRVTT